MGRKRGSKNKSKEVVAEQSVKTTDAVEDKPAALPNADPDSVDFSDTERESMYEEFDNNRTKYMPSIADSDETPAETDTEMSEDTVTEKTAEPDAEISETTDTGADTPADADAEISETTETVADETVTGFAPKELEEEKTVPHGAFHEEREKRKDLQRKLDALEAKMKSTDTDYVDATDEKITQLERQILELQERDKNRELRDEKSELTDAIAHVDKIMADKGKPGFATIGRNHVTTVLSELYDKNPEVAIKYDNPEGWAEIWDAEYDVVKQYFTAGHKESVLNDKRNLKSKANLIKTAGKAPVTPEKKEEEWTREDYARQREKSIL